jgi:hypothetical protein
MIPGYATVLAASADDRRDLFVGAGNRLGTVQQNTERISGFVGRWTLFSPACKPKARGCCSKEELRCPRRTD